MIGTKKLSTIRREIEQALACTGEDPIQALERHIAAAKRKGRRSEPTEAKRNQVSRRNKQVIRAIFHIPR